MSTRPGQQVVIALLFVGVLVGGGDEPLRVALAGGPAGFGLMVMIEKPAYSPGGEVVVTLEIVNETPHPVTFSFPTSQRYDFAIIDEQGAELWRWSKNRMFATVLGEETIGGGRPRLTYRERFRLSLPSGRYHLLGTMTDRAHSLSGRVLFAVR